MPSADSRCIDRPAGLIFGQAAATEIKDRIARFQFGDPGCGRAGSRLLRSLGAQGQSHVVVFLDKSNTAEIGAGALERLELGFWFGQLQDREYLDFVLVVACHGQVAAAGREGQNRCVRAAGPKRQFGFDLSEIVGSQVNDLQVVAISFFRYLRNDGGVIGGATGLGR